MIPRALEPWWMTQPRRYRIAFRIRYAVFSIPKIGPRLGNWWIDR